MSFLEVECSRFWTRILPGSQAVFVLSSMFAVVDSSRRPFSGGVPLDAHQLTCFLARLATYVRLGKWAVDALLDVLLSVRVARVLVGGCWRFLLEACPRGLPYYEGEQVQLPALEVCSQGSSR